MEDIILISIVGTIIFMHGSRSYERTNAPVAENGEMPSFRFEL